MFRPTHLAIFSIITSNLLFSQTKFSDEKVIVESVHTRPLYVFTADLDGDGDMDVLSASFYDNKIAWYQNDGFGNFGDQQIITTSANGATCVYAADLDGDGDMDVLPASSFEDTISWYENDGSGAFGSQRVITTHTVNVRSVYASDLDGDGDMDVLSASWRDNTIAWYQNSGSGVFESQQVITTSAAQAWSVYASDLDGDGDMDVLSASCGDDKIAWYQNDGSGIFGSQQVVTTSADEAEYVYAADLDGDGDMDVLSASFYDNKIAWYQNDGSGGFGNQQVITTSAVYAGFVYASDLDGDGDMDVLSASRGDDKIAWYENDGAGNFGNQQIITTSAGGARCVYTADLDEDGDMDVLSASEGDDKIAWYENLKINSDSSSFSFAVDPISGIKPLKVQFTDMSIDSRITSWHWDFGDGGSSTKQNPTYTYLSSGVYSVILRHFNGSGGQISFYSMEDYIICLPSEPPAFSNTLFSENFESELSPLWSFKNPDRWEIQTDDNSLIINTSEYDGGANDKLGEYALIDTVLNGNFSLQFNAKSNEIINDNASDLCGIFGYINDDNYYYIMFNTQFTQSRVFRIKDGTREQLQKRYGKWINDNEYHTIQMICADSALWVYHDSIPVFYCEGLETNGKVGVGSYNDAAAFDDIIIKVEESIPDAPVANFKADITTGFNPLTVHFSDSSTGITTSWLWNFGDGDTSHVQNPVHEYTYADSFTVTLIVSGPGGADTLSMPDYIIVQEQKPTAHFGLKQIIGLPPLTVEFTDSSTGVITSWLWDFGDGDTSHVQNPTHTYTNADTFTVTLTVSGPGGADTLSLKNLIIVLNPTAVQNGPEIPKEFALMPIYPNPFNPTANIRFSLPKQSEVTVSVYNSKGVFVVNVLQEMVLPGLHHVSWEVQNQPSGMYLIRIKAGHFQKTQKCILLK